MTPEDIRQALLPLLLRPLTPAQRELLATALEEAARTQRELAAAERREQTRPAAERVTPRAPHAGPGRAPSMFVRIALEPHGKDGRERLRIYIGRGLWYAIGSPARIDIQRTAGLLVLRPAQGDAGYALAVGSGMPRAFVDGAADVLRLEPGRYSAVMRGGALVVGERVE